MNNQSTKIRNQTGSTFFSEFKFTWIINEAKNIFELKSGHRIHSPSITDGDNLKWIISFYPNGKRINENCISLFLGLSIPEKLNSSLHSPQKVTCNIYFVNKKGELSYKVFDFGGTINPNLLNILPNEVYGCKGKTIYKNDLPSNIIEYIDENGNLKLYCEIIKENHIYKFEQNSDDSDDSDMEVSSISDDEVCFECSEFQKVLNNEKFSDIKLVIGNVSFSAHKVILAAKSPVFMTIIEKDETVPIIEINDTKENVLKEMLRYMYIGTVENIDDIAVDLLSAASKYQLKPLINLCEDHLIKNLNPENAIELLLTAEANNTKYLKREAIKIIAKNLKEKMDSSDWSKLNFNLVTDILRSVAN